MAFPSSSSLIPAAAMTMEDYLQVRQKLKEKIRQKYKNQVAPPTSSTNHEDFGSFFGPSGTVIASHVLEEAALLEKESAVEHKRGKKRKVVNEVKTKTKAQVLKDLRDYSFLQSDETDMPGVKEEEEEPANNVVSDSNSEKNTKLRVVIKNLGAKKVQYTQSRAGAEKGNTTALSNIKSSNISDQKKTGRQSLNGAKSIPNKPSAPPKKTILHDSHQKRRRKVPTERELEAQLAFAMLRKMTNYDPSKYADIDRDDRNMEAGFHEIEKEERRSLKIARKEDGEQLRLLEEEEKRKMKQKKQKC